MYRVNVLTVTAFLELGTGLMLLLVPAIPLALLLGVREAAPETLLVARVAGAALLALGVASWLARDGEQSAAKRGLLIALGIYDVAAAALLAYAGLSLGMVGMVLWPAVAIHAGLAVWCVASLRTRQSSERK
jgi:hypothetical protein